jgi:hypothetical protein
MCAGNSFQIVAAAIGKERLPMDCKRHRGTISRSDAVDRRPRRLGASAVRVSCDDKYRGAVPWRARYVSTATLKVMRSGTRSQCKLRSASVM